MGGADWGPVAVAVVLFVVLSPGLLFQLPARRRVLECGNMTTSGISILVPLPEYNATIANLQLKCSVPIKEELEGLDWMFLPLTTVLLCLSAVWGWAGPKLTYSTLLGSRHVEFVSLDRCKEENGIRRQSLFSQATNPEADILLPYEMNGEGGSINVQLAQECHVCLSVSAKVDQLAFEFECNLLKPGKVSIKRYAVSGGGCGIEREWIYPWIEAKAGWNLLEHRNQGSITFLNTTPATNGRGCCLKPPLISSRVPESSSKR
ncbi:hypothetical protein Bca101_084945 [Brassica carinata]